MTRAHKDEAQRPDREDHTLPVIDSLQDIVELAEDRSDVFVRYSADPFADISSVSVDYEAHLEMPGISVSVLRPESWWTRPTSDWVARRICKYRELQDKDPSRRPWILTGTVVGSGPDHEPLVAEAVPVAWISETALGEAEKRYHERFTVGQDSTRQ